MESQGEGHPPFKSFSRAGKPATLDAHHPGAARPLFARLMARAASEQMTLKQLLRNYVEQGLNAAPPTTAPKRTAACLPQLNSPLSMSSNTLSNAALFELLDS